MEGEPLKTPPGPCFTLDARLLLYLARFGGVLAKDRCRKLEDESQAAVGL
jgi:hypothetical protein